ncbi:MAG: division/cell wall cluster transcriptional repressor MraZ [Planctomycetota bacterium]|jgi:MraZ protein|nr:division/cell wall cluster transcriptional repressor MraZ [Planctomycetota bacterium]MDP6518825.1 division/cell wall cluster transcriptional repressor MraZ [Planctomycetota bacterium]MDP6837939.1 division/cell wall cluster transcriptional repressor MraZ [Planctomycetota bacterium]MDP6956822.1 division/cell wall cluster transcriptional repressor MraZ [Planctomycetota bacterium]
MFFGESTHSMDAKNRVFVPKRFQNQLPLDGDGVRAVVLTRGLDGCLFLFSEDGFTAALARLETESFSSRGARNKQRLFFSNSTRLNLDASGRMLVPEKLKALAGLAGEVVMVGAGERAELWSVAAWEQLVAEQDGDFEDLDDVLGKESPGKESNGG